MQHFYVFTLRKQKKWLGVIILALFTAIFFLIERDGVFSTFSSDEETVAFTKGNKDDSNIALTFNISWGQEKVLEILNQLEKENVQATFFVSGEWAERHPGILQKITEGKHELGMLGYRYKSYLEQELPQVRKDMLYAKEVFRKLGFKNITLVRPPHGHFNKEVIKLAEQLGLTVVHWNVNTNDWENPGTDAIIKTVMEQTSNGDIILMHASDSVKQTANALKTILPKLKDKGYKFVPITELINQAHAQTKLVE